VLFGPAKQQLADAWCAQFDQRIAQQPDSRHPDRRPDSATSNALVKRAQGVLLAKGVERTGTRRRGVRAHLRDNLTFYGAPGRDYLPLAGPRPPGLFPGNGFCLAERSCSPWVACGLGSCPQFSVAGYPDVIRTIWAWPPDESWSVGWQWAIRNESAPVNGFRPSRAELAITVRWHEI